MMRTSIFVAVNLCTPAGIMPSAASSVPGALSNDPCETGVG